MQFSDLPGWHLKRFAQDAAGAYVRSIPDTTVDPAAASFALGFPPQTFTDESAGGTPPDGRDFNGILNFLSSWAQWVGAGGPVPWNASIASATGYPKGAVVASGTTDGVWFRSTTDNNVTNPDAGGAGWTRMEWSAGQNVNGYWSKSPDGNGGTLIRQRGFVTLPANAPQPTSTANIVFPIEFTQPTSIFITGSPANPPAVGWSAITEYFQSMSNAGCQVVCDTTNGTTTPFSQNVLFRWWAEGY